MSNDIRLKRFPITLDKERFIVFDLDAFIELEERFGSVSEAMDALRKGSIKSIRTILWLGLKADDETLTEQQVGKIVLITELPELSNVLLSAMGFSLPEPKEEDMVDEKKM